jgi:hypothetical protein
MNKKRVWQYQCEFCGKKNYSAGHMKKHESICTMNPHRVCGFCALLGDNLPHKSDILVAAALKGEFYLRDVTENCPACILAGIRQSGLLNKYYDRPDKFKSADEDYPWYVKFNFNAEKKVFWDCFRETFRKYY